MKKSIALLLSATMLIGSSMALTGCKAEFTDDGIKITEDKKSEDTNSVTEEKTETKTEEGNSVGTATEETKTEEKTETKTEETKSNSVATTPATTTTGASTLNVNETVTIGDVMELTLESAEWTEEIDPSNTDGYYSSITDKEGEKFFVVKGKVKNLAGSDLDLSWKGFKGEMLINDTYKSDLSIDVEESDGTGFYGEIKPLQTLNIIIYASISDELQAMAENASLNLKFVNDAEYVDEYFYEDKVPFNEYNILFTK